ncbi:hypothetical protein Q3G72_030668 [Acer saccharum]|nr:hypothetical protein Q3G72_030668 [Acer saccharum]
MRRLQVLKLQGNRLQGSIPSEICNLRNLVDLYLSDNKFYGSVPACLGDITSLRVLHLNSNNLTSTIPSSLWNLKDIVDLNLSYNSLIGKLPLDIGNLRAVSYIDLAWNELSGEIPSSFGNLQTLINFSIAHNKLKGHIPESFGNLISLELLELSSNNLLGAIPKSLEKLRYLKYFNMSFNRLDGEVPTGGAFANFSAGSFIGNGQLCGAPRLQVPPCKTDEKGSPHMMNNLVLGFNEGVEVALPNDEFEKSPPTEETTFAVPQISAGIVAEEQGSFDGICGTLQPVDVPSQHPVTSSVNMAPPSNQTVLHTVSAGPSQAEVPVKLQFGLFSGPSLIPSPVPAIQIGSIQMPLLHPHVDPSLAHLHPSQPPIFQFGQLRYTSPISQRVLPLGPQSVPFVQPNKPAKLSTNQNVGLVQGHMDLSQGNVLNEVASLPARESAETTVSVQEGRAETSQISFNNKTRSESGFLAEDQGQHNSVMRNFKSISTKESDGLLNTGAVKEKYLTASKGQGPASGGRGKKYVVSVRSKSSFVAPESSRSDSSGFQRRPRHQRTEFRVRENADKQHSTSNKAIIA